MEPDEESTIFDLEVLKKNLENEEPQFDEMNDQWFLQIYLGSVMSILPSGKYYTPFACSNVEVCEACKEAHHVPCTLDNPCTYPDDPGDDTPEDYHCEACQDARWYEQAEKELDLVGAYLVSGEGDPTDLFVQQTVEAVNDE